jgi:HEAT repeat protein
MQKRIKLWIGLALVALVAGVLAVPSSRAWLKRTIRNDQPNEDRTDKDWIADLNSPDADTRANAAKALGKSDAPDKTSETALAKALSDDANPVRVQASFALSRMKIVDPSLVAPLSKSLSDPIMLVRWNAILAFSHMGPDAKEAVPALVRALEDKSNRQVLNPLPKSVFDMTVETLGRIGPDAKDAVPALSTVMTSEKNIIYRVIAARAIWRITKDTKATMPVILAGLKSDNFEASDAAIETADMMGSDAKESVPLLIKALKDKQRTTSIRGQAASALGKMAGDAKEVVPALVAVLDDPEFDVQRSCVLALGSLGPAAQSATPALTRLAKQGDARLRKPSSEALAKVNPQAAAQLGTN